MKEVSIAEADRVVQEVTWAGLLANVTKMTLWAEATDGNDGNGYDNIHVGPTRGVPAASGWGLIITALLLLMARADAFGRRRVATAT